MKANLETHIDGPFCGFVEYLCCSQFIFLCKCVFVFVDMMEGRAYSYLYFCGGVFCVVVNIYIVMFLGFSIIVVLKFFFRCVFVFLVMMEGRARYFFFNPFFCVFALSV